MDRRKFMDYLGKGAVALPLMQTGLVSCSDKKTPAGSSLQATREDRVSLIEGLDYQVFIKWGDRISDTDYFGYSNHFTTFMPISEEEGFLWVNHENINTFMVSGYVKDGDLARHVNQIRQEMYNIGGSLVRIRKSEDLWKVINDPANFRLIASQKIPFEWYEGVHGRKEAAGTVANGAGGTTPWGTILICEADYSTFYGEYDYVKGEFMPGDLEWESFTGNPTQHYGWMVEVDPQKQTVRKHIGLGRFFHAGCCVVPAAGGGIVVYTSDGHPDGCLYKYVSEEAGKIYPGKLYVANFNKGTWEQVDFNRDGMQGKFLSDTEMMIRCREASRIVGGTPVGMLAGVAADPASGEVLVAVKSSSGEDPFGHIFRLQESGSHDRSMTFESKTYRSGGEGAGFACPGDMAFDPWGNLWFASDIPSGRLGTSPYHSFGNNGLFVVLRHGPQAGQLLQVASAPMEARFSGISFMPDGRTLLVSVQHPGVHSGPDGFTSNWPHGEGSFPKPSVIALSGPFLEAIQNVV